MTYTVIKIFLTAAIIVAVSEIAKRSTFLGAVIASLPLTSVLAFIWLYFDTGEVGKIAELSKSIFWYVLPSLALFIALPILLSHGVGFWISLIAASALTFICYLAMIWTLAKFDIAL